MIVMSFVVLAHIHETETHEFGILDVPRNYCGKKLTDMIIRYFFALIRLQYLNSFFLLFRVCDIDFLRIFYGTKEKRSGKLFVWLKQSRSPFRDSSV